MFPVQDELALTGHHPEVYLNWPLLSLWTLHLLVNFKQEQQRKGKETEGVYRLVEGTRMRVVESKSWAFPKWPAQHNNTPHLGLMDAFNVCAVKYMCVCGIFIYLYSLITGEIPNKVHACAYIVCWYVVWQHRVGEQVCVCECVRVLKRAQTARRQQSALPVTAERRQKTERPRERERDLHLFVIERARIPRARTNKIQIKKREKFDRMAPGQIPLGAGVYQCRHTQVTYRHTKPHKATTERTPSRPRSREFPLMQLEASFNQARDAKMGVQFL